MNFLRLRAACDSCHQLKVRCSGDVQCKRCNDSGFRCVYSPYSPQGRPKGAKNKRHNTAQATETSNSSEHSRPNEDPNQSPRQRPPKKTDTAKSVFHATSQLDAHQPTDGAPAEIDPNIMFFDPSASMGPGWGMQDTFALACLDYEMADHHSSTVGDSSDASITRQHPSSAFGEDALSSANHNGSNCVCLQRQADLLLLVKNSNGSEGLDKVLAAIQEALRTWSTFLNCLNCASNNDQEILLLACMSIRAILAHLQRHRTVCGPPDFHVYLGDFEVTGEEKQVVLQTMASFLIQKIGKVAAALSQNFDRKMASRVEKAPSSPIGDDYEDDHGHLLYTKQVITGLISSIKSAQRF